MQLKEGRKEVGWQKTQVKTVELDGGGKECLGLNLETAMIVGNSDSTGCSPDFKAIIEDIDRLLSVEFQNSNHNVPASNHMVEENNLKLELGGGFPIILGGGGGKSK